MNSKAKKYAEERCRALFVSGGRVSFPEIEEELAKAFDAGHAAGKTDATRREFVAETQSHFERGMT